MPSDILNVEVPQLKRLLKKHLSDVWVSDSIYFCLIFLYKVRSFLIRTLLVHIRIRFYSCPYSGFYFVFVFFVFFLFAVAIYLYINIFFFFLATAPYKAWLSGAANAT